MSSTPSIKRHLTPFDSKLKTLFQLFRKNGSFFASFTE